MTMTIPPANYKTFAELAEYARQRAKHSAARRAPQDFEYWEETYQWALSLAQFGSQDIDQLQELLLHEIEIANRQYSHVPAKAKAHARAIHIRRMLTNREEKIKPPRLSLAWLREEAERL